MCKSNANILHYKNELQNLKKLGLSMTEYLMKFKSLVDNLSFANDVVFERDQILQILNGLGYEFSPIMMTIMARLSNYFVDEVFSLLLTIKKSLEKTASSGSFTENFASNHNQRGKDFTRSSNYNGNRGGNNNNSVILLEVEEREAEEEASLIQEINHNANCVTGLIMCSCTVITGLLRVSKG